MLYTILNCFVGFKKIIKLLQAHLFFIFFLIMYHLKLDFLTNNLNKIYKRTIYDIKSVGPLPSNPNKRPIQCNLADIDKLLHNNMKVSI